MWYNVSISREEISPFSWKELKTGKELDMNTGGSDGEHIFEGSASLYISSPSSSRLFSFVGGEPLVRLPILWHRGGHADRVIRRRRPHWRFRPRRRRHDLAESRRRLPHLHAQRDERYRGICRFQVIYQTFIHHLRTRMLAFAHSPP